MHEKTNSCMQMLPRRKLIISNRSHKAGEWLWPKHEETECAGMGTPWTHFKCNLTHRFEILWAAQEKPSKPCFETVKTQ